MGLGSKLFRAGISSKIGAGPLAVQNKELDFLRDELNNIAAEHRALAQQELSNQGAMQRTQLTAEAALLRENLGNIHAAKMKEITEGGMNVRQQIGIATGLEQDVAATGAIVPSGADRDVLLSQIVEDAVRIRLNKDLETQRSNFDRAFDNFTTMKARWPGLDVNFEQLVSGKFDQRDLSRLIDIEEGKKLAAVQLFALERLQVGENAPSEMINLIKTTQSPDMSLLMARSLESSGKYSEREISQFFIAASWARHEAGLNGTAGARAAIEQYMDLTSKRISPNATGIPGAMAIFDRDSKRRREEIVAEINSQMVPGSDFDLELIAKFGQGVLQAFPGWTGVTDQTFDEIRARQANAEVERREELTDMVFPEAMHQDAATRQSTMFQDMTATIMAEVGPDATSEEMLAEYTTAISTMQTWIDSFKNGIHPNDIRPDLLMSDLQMVQMQLINQISGGQQ